MLSGLDSPYIIKYFDSFLDQVDTAVQPVVIRRCLWSAAACNSLVNFDHRASYTLLQNLQAEAASMI